VLRCDGNNFEPREFQIFAPIALAGIGTTAIPETVADRAIMVEMRRMLPHETITEFESDEVPSSKDFTFTTGCIETPNGDWDFIDKIFYKGEELEIVDWLDNSGKSSTLEIFTHDDRILK
jgi:hypothetical protein